MTTTPSPPSAKPAGRSSPTDDGPTPRARPAIRALTAGARPLLPAPEPSSPVGPARFRSRGLSGYRRLRRLTGRSDGGTVNDGRGIQAACRTGDRSEERGVQRPVGGVRLPLDDVTAEQTKSPAHQLVRRRRPLKDPLDALDLGRRQRRRRTAPPAVQGQRTGHAVAVRPARAVHGRVPLLLSVVPGTLLGIHVDGPSELPGLRIADCQPGSIARHRT